MTRSAFLASGALALGLLAQSARALPPPQADTWAPGVSLESTRAVGQFDACATLPDGNRVVFDGVEVRLVADDGTLISVLGTASRYGFPSFVLPDPTSSYAIVGESSTGKIRKVDLGGGGMSFLAHLEFNYAAVFEDATHVLVSAAPCGFGCGSEIYRLEVPTGTLTLVASVTGPSGPVAMSASGDLYYGSSSDTFPPPPRPIFYWTRSQLSGGTVLAETDATTFVPAVHPASSLAFDPVSGHLFVAAPVSQGVSEVLEFASGGQQVASVVQSWEYLSGIELLPTQGHGSFQAFQPQGVVLKYRGTDFQNNTSSIRTLRARRPRAWTTGPGLSGPGPVTFHVAGAHPSASVLLVVGLSSQYNPVESTYDMGTFLLHTGLDLQHVRELTTLATDASGNASFTFQNPGTLQGTRVLQAWIRDPSSVLVGTSTAAFN